MNQLPNNLFDLFIGKLDNNSYVNFSLTNKHFNNLIVFLAEKRRVKQVLREIILCKKCGQNNIKIRIDTDDFDLINGTKKDMIIYLRRRIKYSTCRKCFNEIDVFAHAYNFNALRLGMSGLTYSV